jgi:hypothetical protein
LAASQQFLETRSAFKVQSASPLVGVCANDCKIVSGGICCDGFRLVEGRIILLVRRHAHILRCALARRVVSRGNFVLHRRPPIIDPSVTLAELRLPSLRNLGNIDPITVGDFRKFGEKGPPEIDVANRPTTSL